MVERPVDEKLRAYIEALLPRRGSAQVVNRINVRCEAFQPLPHHCHQNAKEWIEFNPGHEIARGWLVFDFRATALIGQRPRFEFLAHSVVQNAGGDRFDVTPTEASRDYPFLEHFGDDSQFDEFMANYGIVRLRAYADGNSEMTYDEAA